MGSARSVGWSSSMTSVRRSAPTAAGSSTCTPPRWCRTALSSPVPKATCNARPRRAGTSTPRGSSRISTEWSASPEVPRGWSAPEARRTGWGASAEPGDGSPTTTGPRGPWRRSPPHAIAAGDDGVILRFDGKWHTLESGVQQELRSSVRVGAVTYVVGDAGTALVVEGNAVRPVAKLTTTCSLRSVFAHGNEVWFVGYEGTLAGVWRQSGDRIDRWGTC